MGCSESTPTVEVDLTNYSVGDKINVARRCPAKHKGEAVPFTVKGENTKFLGRECDYCRMASHASESGAAQFRSLKGARSFVAGAGAFAV
jgi:hypothetical protein